LSDKQLLKETQAIKKLLILLLVKSGSNSEEIGRALGVDSSSVRHMVPMTISKKEKGE
jgi:hypothetical protein